MKTNQLSHKDEIKQHVKKHGYFRVLGTHGFNHVRCFTGKSYTDECRYFIADTKLLQELNQLIGEK